MINFRAKYEKYRTKKKNEKNLITNLLKDMNKKQTPSEDSVNKITDKDRVSALESAVAELAIKLMLIDKNNGESKKWESL